MFDTTTLSGHVHQLGDHRIFVFGSNIAGIHGGGAAWYASKKLGAVMGVGEGLTGQTYALPTCYNPGEPVTYSELMVYVQNFLDFATSRPDLHFFVSAVGCGIAGFTEAEVGPLFKDAPSNCDLPPGWRDPVCMGCGKPGTHLYRFDYPIEEGESHAGAALLCDEHYEEAKELSTLDNTADPAWVVL